MAGPQAEAPRPALGLFHSFRSFWGILVALLYTRLDLLTTELREEAMRGLALVVAVCGVLLCGHAAFFFAMLFILAAFWETHRLLVIGLIFGFYLVSALGLLVWLRYLLAHRPRFLGQTLQELRRDVSSLQGLIVAQLKSEKTEDSP